MNSSEKISKYLTIGDAIRSETAIRHGIDNSMNEGQLENAKYFAVNVFDPVKDKFPGALCTSFFRSPEVNKMVGGSPSSFHSFAGAIDIDTFGNADNKAIFKWAIDGNVPANEIIWEYGTMSAPDWVHIGLLKGYTTHIILHIYYLGEGEKRVKMRDSLTKEEAYKRFGLGQ